MKYNEYFVKRWELAQRNIETSLISMKGNP
jgi:hypothetical protein